MTQLEKQQPDWTSSSSWTSPQMEDTFLTVTGASLTMLGTLDSCLSTKDADAPRPAFINEQQLIKRFMNNEAKWSHFGNLFLAAFSSKTAVVWFQMSVPLFDLIVAPVLHETSCRLR